MESFRHYLGQWNGGRPFVLIGHSQGSGLLSRMITDEIDEGSELREQMVSALLIGIGVNAPPGEDVGGDFQNVPACRTAGQTGCVISYASSRATADGVVDGFFGEHDDNGNPICTNPAVTVTYLAVTVNADPDDPRIDDVGGDFLPGWGLHIIDMNLAIDDLVQVVAEQTAS